MDAAGIQYVYNPVRQVKRCICIEMLYVTSGDIFYLHLILLNAERLAAAIPWLVR